MSLCLGNCPCAQLLVGVCSPFWQRLAGQRVNNAPACQEVDCFYPSPLHFSSETAASLAPGEEFDRGNSQMLAFLMMETYYVNCSPG